MLVNIILNIFLILESDKPNIQGLTSSPSIKDNSDTLDIVDNSSLIVEDKNNDALHEEQNSVNTDLSKNDYFQDNKSSEVLSKAANTDVAKSSSGMVTPHSDISASDPGSALDIRDMITIEKYAEDENDDISKNSVNNSQSNVSVSTSGTVTPKSDDKSNERSDYENYSDDWVKSAENTDQHGNEKEVSIPEEEHLSKSSSIISIAKSIDESLAEISDNISVETLANSVEEDITSAASNSSISVEPSNSVAGSEKSNVDLNESQDSSISKASTYSKNSASLKDSSNGSRTERSLDDIQNMKKEESGKLIPESVVKDDLLLQGNSENLESSISEEISEAIEDYSSHNSSVNDENKISQPNQELTFSGSDDHIHVANPTDDAVSDRSDKSIASDLKQERSSSTASQNRTDNEENILDTIQNFDPQINMTSNDIFEEEADIETNTLNKTDTFGNFEDEQFIGSSKDVTSVEEKYSDEKESSEISVDAISDSSPSNINRRAEEISTTTTVARESYQWNSLESVSTNMTVNLLDDALLAILKIRSSKESRAKALESSLNDQKEKSATNSSDLSSVSATSTTEDPRHNDSESLLNLTGLPDPSISQNKVSDMKEFGTEIDDLYNDFENNGESYQDFIHESLSENKSVSAAITEISQEAIQYFVPHMEDYVREIVSLAVDHIIGEFEATGSTAEIKCPNNFNYNKNDIKADTEFEKSSLRSYHVMIFDLVKEILDEYYKYNEIAGVNLPSWMKPKRLQLPTHLRSVPLNANNKIIKEHTIEHVVELLKLGSGKDTNASKKNLKKDLVDAILAQELAEEEPDWINYDKDETSVKMQVADSILSSLLEETSSLFKFSAK